MKKFNLVVCGGTFDLFHKGHRELLLFALSRGKKVVVGLTSDAYHKNSKLTRLAGKQNSKLNEPYAKRKESIEKFLEKKGIRQRTEIVPIDDMFGPTLSKDIPFEAIVVTKQTLKGALTVNRYRKQKKLNPLEIIICPMVYAENKMPISSSRIRDGQINREGKPYIHANWFTKKLILTDELRQKLKQPLGVLFKNGLLDYQSIDPGRVITVGDVVTKSCNDNSFGQNISVIDFHVGREKRFDNLEQLGFLGNEKVIKIDNPASVLTPALFRAAVEVFALVKRNMRIRIIVQIRGEEDLSVLPLALASPLGFTILYGQPNEGVVKVVVSEESKKHIHDLVNSFSTSY